MNTINKIRDALVSIATYSAQLFTYIVTLGHSEFPRFKKTNDNTIVTPKTLLEDRSADLNPSETILPNLLEKEKDQFLNQLKESEAESFTKSEEYNAFKKDTSVFPSISEYYQAHKASAFLDKLEINKEDFLKSPEYKKYLTSNPFSLNPFEIETLDTAYENYQKALAERLRSRMDAFNINVPTVLAKYESEGENLIIEEFKKSEEYLEPVEKMKKDITFSFTLDDVREAYDAFKKGQSEKQEAFLNSLKDKDAFTASNEYLAVDKKPLFKDLVAAYKIYQELKNFKATLPQGFRRSVEYTTFLSNPFHTLQGLKETLDQYEQKTFLDSQNPKMINEFKKSEQYKNSFSTVTELSKTYDLWCIDEVSKSVEYRKSLKSNDADYYNKFTGSREYKEAILDNVTLAGMKAAFETFEKRVPKPSKSWFGW